MMVPLAVLFFVTFAVGMLVGVGIAIIIVG